MCSGLTAGTGLPARSAFAASSALSSGGHVGESYSGGIMRLFSPQHQSALLEVSQPGLSELCLRKHNSWINRG
jgi:hypothetical protein